MNTTTFSTPVNAGFNPGIATPPKGWFIAEEDTNTTTGPQNSTIPSLQNKHLALAAEKTTEFIHLLQDNLGLNVPEAYLRIEEGNVFHVLLFIHQSDYLSPKVMAARILSRNYTKVEGHFDIKISYCNQEENNRKNLVIQNGYTLKHVEDEHQQQTASWIR